MRKDFERSSTACFSRFLDCPVAEGEKNTSNVLLRGVRVCRPEHTLNVEFDFPTKRVCFFPLSLLSVITLYTSVVKQISGVDAPRAS